MSKSTSAGVSCVRVAARIIVVIICGESRSVSREVHLDLFWYRFKGDSFDADYADWFASHDAFVTGVAFGGGRVGFSEFEDNLWV